MKPENKNRIIGWWSGGITSCITCHLLLELYPPEDVEFIFIDTKNEDEDTYRFKADCEKWWNKKISTISDVGTKYKTINEVWIKYKSLNVSHGAICSSELKRSVRQKWETKNKYKHQAFGFDISESNRAKSIKLNHPKTKPIFPLLMFGFQKKDCFAILKENNIEPPKMYKYGFHNNNCFKTGCVQGGIGYWQKMKREFPSKFDAMALVEHQLTELRGSPVTMLKDQSKEATSKGANLVFLKPHPLYPQYKDISKMKGREPKPLMECNGFCSSNDLEPRNETEKEINFKEYKQMKLL